MADFVSRSDWGSAWPRGGYSLIGPLAEVYVHHFGGEGFDYSAVGAVALGLVRGAQRAHIGNGWADIGYSWLVDDAGVIIEGRGWLRTGAHTEGWNSKGHGICWIGNSELRWPSAMALEGFARCIRFGQAAGAVVASPTIVGHSDRVPGTACCGDRLREQLPIIRQLVANRNAQVPVPVSSYPTTDEEPPVIHAMQLPRTDTPGDATIYVRNEATGRVWPMERLGGLEVYNELVSRGLARPFVEGARLSWNANLARAIIDEANNTDDVPDVPRPGRFPVDR